MFSGKNYTADKNFTRPPVAPVATNSKSGYDADGAGDAVLQGDGDDQDHGDDYGVDDNNLNANQSDTRILVGQTPTSFHPVLPSEQLGRQVGRRFFKPVCFVSFP